MFKRVIAALVLALGLGAAVAPASASASQTPPPGAGVISPQTKSECAFGTVCIWDNINYSGFLVSHYGAPGTCWNVPASVNDRAESFYNHLGDGHHVQFYQDANCTGHLMCSDIIDSCGPYPDGRADDFATLLSRHNGYTSANRTSSFFYNNG